MNYIQIKKLFMACCFFCGISLHVFAEPISDPCAGPSALLSIVDRPTVGDSVCVVPYGNLVAESGFQYQQLPDNGQQQNFPDAELRLGLPASNELVFLPPNYIHQSMPSQSGYGASVVGVKHEIGYNQHWLGAVEALFTLPSGSDSFGSDGLGEAFNGIVSYTFNSKFNVTFLFGGSSQTLASNNGGQRFDSINPDMVFTWSAQQRMDVYAEVYGQSKTAPGEGSGFNFDSGIVYLLFKNLTVDFEVGQRISGTFGGFDHYVGTGLAIKL